MCAGRAACLPSPDPPALPLPLLLQYAAMSGISKQAVATAAARMLLKLAQDKGSVDDITVIVNLYEWS